MSSIRVENNCKRYMNMIENAVRNEIADEIGVTGVAEIQSNTPVDKGILKKSITFKKLKAGDKYRITFGSKVIYAPIVEFKGKSKGFFRDSLKSIEDEAISIILEHLKEIDGVS